MIDNIENYWRRKVALNEHNGAIKLLLIKTPPPYIHCNLCFNVIYVVLELSEHLPSLLFTFQIQIRFKFKMKCITLQINIQTVRCNKFSKIIESHHTTKANALDTFHKTMTHIYDILFSIGECSWEFAKKKSGFVLEIF